jgi:hypothetical protein
MRRPAHPPAVAAMLAIALACVLAATVLAIRGLPPSPTARQGPGDAIQGPQSPPVTITAPSGRQLTCPHGAVPYVNITNAYFAPKLVHGTSFGSHTRYRVILTGTVINETTAPITITDLHPVAAGLPWTGATLSGPSAIAADTSVPLTIRGSYTTARTVQANVGAHLAWRWADPNLTTCASRGLNDDD